MRQRTYALQRHTRDRRGHLVAKELNELIDSTADKVGALCSRAMVFAVVGQNVGNQDVRRMAVAELRATLIG